MSYPPPLYLGDRGELAATYRRAGHAPEVRRATEISVHYLATGASTAGQFGLYRWEMGAGPGGPGPHFHRTISESFYILEGSVAIFDGDSWIDTEPGDWFHVPAGGTHGFKNTSGAPAKMLLHFCPGAPREVLRAGPRHAGRDGGGAGRFLPEARHVLGVSLRVERIKNR
jgi:mannose-6-phosphate isomerase-like protein (cupin superfamily)